MSATIACPPPNDSSDSGAKTSTSPIRRLSSMAASDQIEDKHAERNNDADHRHHREAQHANSAKSHQPNQDRRPVAVETLGDLDTHCQRRGHTHRGGAEQDEMRGGIMRELTVGIAG